MSAKTTQSAEEKTIKRFLRHKNSREYFKAGGWTQDPAEADNFTDVVEAACTCVRYGLSDVEMALRYDTAVNDVFCTSIR